MHEYRTGRHRVFALNVHLVFVTKYRRDVLSQPAIRDLSAMFDKVCVDFGARLIACNGEDDHVHLLVAYPPQVSVSKLVNSLKGVSFRRLRAWRPEIKGRYFKGVLWSPSYLARRAAEHRSASSASMWSNRERGRLLPGRKAGLSGAEQQDEDGACHPRRRDGPDPR